MTPTKSVSSNNKQNNFLPIVILIHFVPLFSLALVFYTHYQFPLLESSPAQVVVAPVGELLARTSCFCAYGGCNCSPEHKPCGIQLSVLSLCLNCTNGCAMMTAAAEKRACCSEKCFTKCLSCDNSDSDSSECFICATSSEGTRASQN